MTVAATEAPGVSGVLERRYEPGRTDSSARPEPALCPDRHLYDGRSCKKRACEVCGARWARRWSQVFLHNLVTGLSRLHGLPASEIRVAMITVTAAGTEHLPWDKSRCLIQGPHQCSGPDGCRVEEEAANEWAADQTERWKKLREASRVSAKRRSASGTAPRVLGRVWEPQKRGVAHLHVAVDCSTPELAEAAELFRQELGRLAPVYKFGFVDRDIAPDEPQKAARYVSGYLTGRTHRHACTCRRCTSPRATARKSSIRQNISHPRMPRSLLWITPQLTRETRVTMRSLRYVGWYLAALSGRCEILPRVFGERLVDVVKAVLVVEAHWRRGPPEDPRDAELRHFKNLRLMRAIQPAFEWSPA